MDTRTERQIRRRVSTLAASSDAAVKVMSVPNDDNTGDQRNVHTSASSDEEVNVASVANSADKQAPRIQKPASKFTCKPKPCNSKCCVSDAEFQMLCFRC